MAKDLKAIVSEIDNLPSLPQVVTTIITLINNPRSSAEDLNRALERDPALVGRILKLVNSAFYGLPNRVSSVRQAIVLLGFSTIRSLALSAAIFDFFGKPRTIKFSRVNFWAHLVGTAGLSRLLAHHESGLNEESAFAAGLLHDMGMLVLDRFVPDEFAAILEIASRKQINFVDAEREVLDTDHGEIGRWLGEKWMLPEELVNAIGYHHDAASCPQESQRMAAVCSFANFLANKHRAPCPGNFARAELDPNVWALLTIRKEVIPELAHQVEEEIERAEKLFGLVLG